MDLSKATLRRMFPSGDDHHVNALAALAPELCARYQITTPRRWVHFLAQIEAETAGLSLYPARENMNYSAQRMLEIFKGRVTAAEAINLAHKPLAIAEHMYGAGTKVGGWLGNTEKGDGAKFIGRGVLQTTGRDAYSKVGRELGVDLVANPEKLENPEIGVRAAFADWNMLRCNPLADGDVIEVVTRKVNGGLNGIAERRAALGRAKAIWGNSMVPAVIAPPAVTPDEAAPVAPAPIIIPPVVAPVPPPVITPHDVASGGSRTMRLIRWLKGLFGGGAVATYFAVNSGTVNSWKDTSHAVYDFLVDPIAVGVALGACGLGLVCMFALEHFQLLAVREGRYVPRGWLAQIISGDYLGVNADTKLGGI